jgi:CBS domain-containing protein
MDEPIPTDLPAEARQALAALREIAPFDRVAPQTLADAVTEARIRPLERGEVLLEPRMGPPEAFHVLLSGRVDGLAGDNDGEPVWSLGRGDSFPLGALLEQRPVGTRQVVAEAGEAVVLPAEAFHRLRRESADFADFCDRRIGHLLTRGPVAEEIEGDAGGSGALLDPATPVRARMEARTLTLDGGTTLSEAARELESHGGEAILVRLPDGFGIATLRDLAFRGLTRPADTTLAEIATRDPVGIDADTSLLEAAVSLAEHGFHHLLVTERGRDEPLGVLDEGALYRVNAMTPGLLHQRIGRARDIEALADIRREVPGIVGALLESGSGFAAISRILSGINDAIARRVIGLTFEDAPLPAELEWCWLTFGSEARSEQTLATDQDNGLVFAGPLEPQTARDHLLPLARRVNGALDQLGYPLCPGEIMAGNPELCLSVDEWGRRFRGWIDQGTPEHLLKATIFFDARGLAGSPSLFEQWAATWREPARKNSRFRRQLAANALRNQPPLSLFGGFRTRSRDGQRGIDIKVEGATPFVDAARIEALAEGAQATRTDQRLALVPERALPADDLVAAYDFIQRLRLRHQYEQIRRGETPDNLIDPDTLDGLTQRLLKESFRIARKLQRHLAIAYQL